MTKSKEKKEANKEALELREKKIAEDNKFLDKIKDKKERKEVEKEMKKLGVSAELAIYSLKLQANSEKASKMYEEFIQTFNGLGFQLKPYFKNTEDTLKASMKMDVLSLPEFKGMQEFYINKKKDNENSEKKS